MRKRTTELLRELRDLACDINTAEIIDHVHITRIGWVLDGQWLDLWHNEFDRIVDELDARVNGSETAKTSDNAPLRTCKIEQRIDGCGVVMRHCGNCGADLDCDTRNRQNYCPNCGAMFLGVGK